MKDKLDYKIMLHFLPHKYSYAQKTRGETILKKLKKGKILDAGVGCGWLMRLAKEKGCNIVGIDIADKVIKQNDWFGKVTGQRICVKKASIFSLPFKNNYFDSVVISEVLEHLENPHKALLEVRRVLKKNGRLILLIPGYSYTFIYDKLLSFLNKLSPFAYNKRMEKKFIKYNLTYEYQKTDVHRFKYSLSSLNKLLTSSGYDIEQIENSEFISPFLNTFFCSFLGIRREKIAFLEKLDTIMLKYVPLFMGSDWLFVCKNLKGQYP